MAQNPRPCRSLTTRALPAEVAAGTLALLPLQLVSEAQQQAPAAPVAAGARGGGPGLGGGRGFGPSMKPSVLRAIPAETTAAKANVPSWKAPRTAWGHPDSGVPVEGRQPIREFGGGKE